MADSFGLGRSFHRRARRGGACNPSSFLAFDVAFRCNFGTLRRAALLRTLSAAIPSGHTRGSRSASATIIASAAAISAGAAPPSSFPPLQPPPIPADLLLPDIRVVLVAPKHEANVGAVARACANFECISLCLVAPRYGGWGGGANSGGSTSFSTDGEARKVACGDVVLDRLVVTSTLAEALADTSGSIGFTRRAGATRMTHASLSHLMADFPWALPLTPVYGAAASAEAAGGRCQPSAAAEVRPGPAGCHGGIGPPPPPPLGDLLSEAAAASREVVGSGGAGDLSGAGVGGGARSHVTALVFGREESGLTEAELRLCSHACAIPTGRLQPSMNLSHAVAAVLAELFSRRCGLLDVAPTPAAAAAVQRAAAAVNSDAGGGGGARLLRLPVVPATGGSSDQEALLRRCSDGNASTSTSGGAVVTAGGGPAAAGAAATTGGGQAGTRGGGDAGLLPASAAEVDLLVRKVAAVAEAVGMSGQDSIGGGNAGNHGRRRLPVGHLRSVVARARLTAAESRALHGLASAVLQRVDPEHPLEARKAQRRQQHQAREQAKRQAGHQQAKEQLEQRAVAQ